jgi:hypothetical protein
MRAISELIRPAAAEIVVAVDSRTPEEQLGQLESVVDKLIRIEYADPPERSLAWLHAQCSSDWILRLDNDEVPSPELIAELPRLIEDETLTHYWLRRRWLYPTVGTYLDVLPWSPNHDLRLTRNDPRFVRYPGVMHVEAEADGPGAWLDLPIYHFDLIVNDAEARRQKAERYERIRSGMRLGGRSVNEAVYLPESRPDARLAEVPAEHVALIRSVIEARDIGGRPNRPVPLAGRAEIDALWPARPLPESAYGASLELASQLEPIAAGERKLLEARVRNEGTACWRWGRDGLPAIRLSYRWLTASGATVAFNGLRAPLPHDLPPGDELLMPLTVEAPAEPGEYLFQLELIHEHNRRFGASPQVPARISRPRRVALLARGDANERLVALAFERPECEVIVVHAREYLVGARGSRIGMLLRLVARTTPLLWAAGRRRGGPELARALVESEALVIEGAPRDRVDRAVETVTKLAARVAGCKVT